MFKVKINASSTGMLVSQFKDQIGGTISENHGECVLTFDSEHGQGCIKFIMFDWGLSLVEFNAIFYKELLLIYDTSNYNPIDFSYCSNGHFKYKSGEENDYTKVEEFHSCIHVGKKHDNHYTLIPKGIHLEINTIKILRRKFLKKRLNNVELLNEKLHEIFVDSKQEKEFSYYSPIDMKMQDYVKALNDIKSKGMIRILQIEGTVYQLLSRHISKYNDASKVDDIPKALQKKDLQVIRRYASKILEEPSHDYTLDYLSRNTGLSQSKLQEGFKYLYTRTVTEYIRHVRLKAARELMKDPDLNISQIVYTIGFTSRSYFSKIFKEKYKVSPNEYRKSMVKVA